MLHSVFQALSPFLRLGSPEFPNVLFVVQLIRVEPYFMTLTFPLLSPRMEIMAEYNKI